MRFQDAPNVDHSSEIDEVHGYKGYDENDLDGRYGIVPGHYADFNEQRGSLPP